MPKRKRKRNYKKRRKRKRFRRRFRRSGYTRYRGLPAIPTKAKIRFRYGIQNVELSSLLGVQDYHTFVANGCYDPDLSGGGHQPFGWDQWSIFFNKYVVRSSKIRAYFTSDGTANGVAGIYLSDGVAHPGDISAMIEAKRGTLTFINNQRTAAKAVSTFSCKKFFNVANVRDVSPQYGALTGTNPSDQAHFIVWYESTGLTSSTVTFHALMEFIVDFAEPVAMTQS